MFINYIIAPRSFVDEIEIITEAQTGFRKGYGTTDNIFTLYALFSIYQSLEKKLYCTFVDFSKAFDSISRAVSSAYSNANILI
jgi:hypothetical protein